MNEQQMAAAEIEVIEVIPPAVNTDLGGPGLHTFGVPVEDFANEVFEGLEKQQSEIGFGTSTKAMRMNRDEIDAAIKFINDRMWF